jgi:hypothetical protein
VLVPEPDPHISIDFECWSPICSVRVGATRLVLSHLNESQLWAEGYYSRKKGEW